MLQNNIATQKEELAAKNIELLTAQAELTGLKALVESQHHSINMVTNITEFLEQHMQQETQVM